ncbi:MAG: T9SS type A sorting domain-containing protein [Bacteroidetes bacterium]|nr:T9SS type A sorting domain-containing protein [Bacteroidota bacterium]
MDTALQVLWDRNYSAGYYSEPIGLSLHDTLLYVAHTEYPGQTLSISSVKLRGISSLTGDSLFMNTVLSQGGQNDVGYTQTIDNSGNVSVFMAYELATGVNRFQLARFDATGLQTGSFLFSDVPGYGERTLLQINSTSLLMSSTVYDSVAFNTNISTWWISTATSSLNSNEAKNKLFAGPVPASDHLRLFGLPFANFRYEILSPLGQLIDQGTLSEGNDRIVLNMKSGFYLLKLYSKETVFTTAFIKQ